MTLTTRFHPHMPPEAHQWKKTTSSSQSCVAFVENMTDGDRRQIIFKIVSYTIISLGLYWIKLKCSKSGQEDLKNLANRHIIHYISHQGLPPTDGEVQDIYHRSNKVSNKEIERREELRKARTTQRGKINNVESLLNGTNQEEISDLFSTCIKHVRSFQTLCTDISQLVKDKKIRFLQKVYKLNPSLTFALDSFFNLNDNEQNSFNFIKHLSTFIKDTNLESILKTALGKAKDVRKEKKSIYLEPFENFRTAIFKLSNKNEWLISLKDDKELFTLAYELLSLNEQFSGKFIDIYKKSGDNFNRCLDSMHNVLVMDKDIMENIKKHFEDWREIAQILQYNLALDLSGGPSNVVYNLRHYLKKELDDAGLKEEMQRAIAPIEMNYRFIKVHFNGIAGETLLKVKKLLDNDEFKTGARKNCAEIITKAKNEEKDANLKVNAHQTVKAFKMLKYYHSSQKIRDFVSLILEAESIIRELYPTYVDEKYFEFLKILRFSEFYERGNEALCDIGFYKCFQPYFDQLGYFQEFTVIIFNKINKEL